MCGFLRNRRNESDDGDLGWRETPRLASPRAAAVVMKFLTGVDGAGPSVLDKPSREQRYKLYPEIHYLPSRTLKRRLACRL